MNNRLRSRDPPQIAPVEVDLTDDDDVQILSPRSFAEARNNARRNRNRVVVVDLDPESSSDIEPRQQQLINLESRSSDSVRQQQQQQQAQPQPPLPPVPAPTREAVCICSICLGPLVEEVTTKCGHIFCKACLSTAIAGQEKCPTCRKKVTMKGTFRIFLPRCS